MEQVCNKVMLIPERTTSAVYMPFMPERLKIARERVNYTQKEVADALGIQPGSYSDFERGRVEPSTERLVQFCQILSCSADFLLGFTDAPDKHLEVAALRPDQQKVLQWWESKKIPRLVKRMLGDLSFPEDDSDTPLIESGDEPDAPGHEKTA